MKGKNILIAIAVFGIGIILYKLLLGFVLPLALIVSLRYVLKFLLKGSEAEAEAGKDASKVLEKTVTSSSDNIVEIQAIQEGTPVEKDKKPLEEDKSI